MTRFFSGAWRSQRCGQAVSINVMQWIVLVFCFYAPWQAVAYSEEPVHPLSDFQHTAFTAHDGAPADILGLAQTPDGLLWIASNRGLYFFDGLVFREFVPAQGESLASKHVMKILALGDGSLVLVHPGNGLTILKNGHLKHFGSEVGLLHLFDVADGGDGQLWIYNNDSVQLFKNGRVTNVLKSTTANIGELAVDSRTQNAWLNRGGHLYVWSPEKPVFEDTGDVGMQGDLATFVEPGVLLLGGAIVHVEGRTWSMSAHPIPFDAGRTTVDRRGALWYPILGGGLKYFPSTKDLFAKENTVGTPDSMTTLNGLSGNFAYPSLEDREGNIWIGTDKGLDRFRLTTFVPLPIPQGMHNASITPGNDNDLWIGSETLPVQHFKSGEFTPTEIGRVHFAMYRDPDNGEVLVAGQRHTESGERYKDFWKLSAGAATQLGALPNSSGPFFLLAKDADQRVWVSSSYGSTTFFVGDIGGDWKKVTVPATPFSLIRIGETLWIGMDGNNLLAVDRATQKLFTSKDGLNVGAVKAVTARGNTIWVAGEKGVEVLVSGHFQSMALDDGTFLEDVTGLIFSNDGALWVHTRQGVFRITPESAKELAEGSRSSVPYRLFNELDGVTGSAPQTINLPSLKMDSTGRIWVQNSSDIMSVDPGTIVRNTLAPDPQILELLGSGTLHSEDNAVIQLPKDQRNIEIDYTAALLGVPERERFRYRLKGLDKTWQDVGNRRQAFFNALPAGKYEFEVLAANEDGVWSPRAASITFAIAPYFRETLWFKTMWVFIALFVFFAAYRYRLYQVTRQLRVRLEERETIARDIHDTLLQSAQNVAIQLELLAGRSDSGVAREKLFQITQYARSSIAEGREKIEDLRESQSDDRYPIGTYIEDAKQIASGYQLDFEYQVQGKLRPLKPRVGAEVRAIVRELVFNAFRHSEGVRVRLATVFEKGVFKVSVSDDGVGVPPDVLAAGGRSGHWGFPGLRERAARIGADLDLRNSEEGGFVAQLSLPAADAYEGIMFSLAQRIFWWRRG